VGADVVHYLITGGAGFIGSHLADALSARGHHVTILDDLSTGSLDNVRHLTDTGRARFVRGSVTDAGLVSELVSGANAVAHLAASVGVELVVRDPLRALQNNVRGTETVLEACKGSEVRVLVTSTSEIYGKNTSDLLSEEADRVMGSPTKSRWAYATSKAVDEIFAYGYWQQFGTPTVVARLFNCSGPRQTGAYGMVIPRFVRQAIAGETVTVYGDGSQTRCFCHVKDTVEALIGLLEHYESNGAVFNVGSSDEIAIGKLAERVIQFTESPSEIRYIPYRDAYEPGFEDMERRVPDTTRIRELTGWQPRRNLEDILRDVTAYQRQRMSSDRP
jgi:UDP-glucose 4-epimerase